MEMKYFVDVATKKNTKVYDKPNEDCVFVNDDNDIFIVMDGVSRDKIDGRYPNPSPALEVSKLFIEEAYEYIRKFKNQETDYLRIIKCAFEEGNKAIYEYNKLYVGDFLPGTVGIIAIIKSDILYYGYIGDCFGILVNEKATKEFTMSQTQLIHEHIKEFTANYVRNNICNNIKHPYAYGVLDGRLGAMDFVITGKLSLDEYKGFLLLTDGAEEVVKQTPIKQLFDTNVQELLDTEVHNSSMDDKTVIFVRKKTNENIVENN